MNPTYKAHKVVDALPSVLETDAIYYVLKEGAIDIFVTGHSSTDPIPLKTATYAGDYIRLKNGSGGNVNKGLVVSSADGIEFVLSTNADASSKHVMGMTVFSSADGTEDVLVQVGGVFHFADLAEMFTGPNLPSGFTPAADYFLGINGQITATAPDASSADVYSLKVARALTELSCFIKLGPTVLLRN